MRKIETAEMKQIQLQILADVVEFCRKYQLRYFLSGGSMLGAVRHKGYIPWDDDIDIQMPRPDYDRFIRSYRSKKYAVRCWEKDRRFLCTYAKVEAMETVISENGDWGIELGVNIDIFPVDGLPKSRLGRKLHIKKMKILWGMAACAVLIDASKRSRMKKLAIFLMKCIYRIIPMQSTLIGATIRAAKRIPFQQSDKVGTVVWGYGEKEVISKETAIEYMAADFEGLSCNIPKNYEEYLQNIYGDYMQLPPVEERIYKHGIKAWKKQTEDI